MVGGRLPPRSYSEYLFPLTLYALAVDLVSQKHGIGNQTVLRLCTTDFWSYSEPKNNSDESPMMTFLMGNRSAVVTASRFSFRCLKWNIGIFVIFHRLSSNNSRTITLIILNMLYSFFPTHLMCNKMIFGKIFGKKLTLSTNALEVSTSHPTIWSRGETWNMFGNTPNTSKTCIKACFT